MLVNKGLSIEQISRELENRLHQQALLADLSRRVLADHSLSALAEDGLNQVCAALSVDCIGLFILSVKGDLVLTAGFGWNTDVLGWKAPIGQASHAGYTLQANEPVVIEYLAGETRFEPSVLLKRENITSGIGTVVSGKNGPVGVLAVYTRQPHAFRPADIDFIQCVANLLAFTITPQTTGPSLPLSTTQLVAILNSVSEGIAVQDQNGQLLYANPSAARTFGFNEVGQLLRTPMEQVLQKFEFSDEAREPLPVERLPGHQALRGEEKPSAVIRFRNLETGRECWSSVDARPVYDSTGQINMAVNIFHDITGMKRIEQAGSFLTEVARLLSSSLEYADTLNRIAKLTVEKLCDWCVVKVLEENEAVNQVAVAHKDPQKLTLAEKLQAQFPPDWEAMTGTANVLRTGKPEFYPEINVDYLRNSIQDPRLLEMLLSLGLKSAIIQPLVARGQMMGVMSLVWAESGHTYTDTDVILAEELARHAAHAIDNSRLFQRAQKLNEELESRVARRTERLHNLIDNLRNEISEREKTEEELLKNEVVLNSLFESAPDGQVIVDDHGTILRANPQLCELFGYHLEELVGNPVEILLPQRFKTRHLVHRLAYMREPRRRTMGLGLELFGRRRDGSEFPVDIMLSALSIGQEQQVIAAIRDISDHKQIEAELAEVQRRLLDNIEAERLALAQELHDGPIQDLYALTYQLSALSSDSATDSGPSSQETLQNDLQGLVQQVIDTLRTISGELRPPALAPYGLETAIQAHIDSLRQAHPELAIHLDLMPDGQDLPEPVRLALYRIYQHSVSNVIRHAEAQNLSVSLILDAEQVILEIQDDGRGFVLPPRWIKLAREGHLGLVGTSERVRAIGGELKIDTKPGQGTLIRVAVPRD